MSKRKIEEDEDLYVKNKFLKKEDSDDDDEDDDGSDDGKKYEILKEDDIEGQEAGEIMQDGDVQITPFNMKEEMEEGHFDSEGMYHWNKENTVKDNWLENIDWIKIKENDPDNIKKQESESDDDNEFDEKSYYKQMLQLMQEKETVARALRRLGGSKSLSASERLKRKKAGLANYEDKNDDKVALAKLTELANTILTRTGNMDIYQETYEEIFNKIKRNENISVHTWIPDLDMYADDFDEKEKANLTSASTSKNESVMCNEKNKEIQWEIKRDLNDINVEGPYSSEQMNTWIKENYFKAHVWVRKVGSNNEFYSSKRMDFELYL